MVRIVKLTFKSEHTNKFIDIFNSAKERIKGADGCTELKLIQDRSDPRIFMTYSVWQGPEFLQQYRRSDLFKEVWSQVRPLFEDEPEAWSLDVLSEL